MMADRSEVSTLTEATSISGRVARDAQAHTSEPWSYELHSLYEGFAAIVYAANGMKVGTDYLSEADARRIVSCVNAFAGIPHPEHLPELIEALGLSEFDHGIDDPTRAAFAKMFDRKG